MEAGAKEARCVDVVLLSVCCLVVVVIVVVAAAAMLSTSSALALAGALGMLDAVAVTLLNVKGLHKSVNVCARAKKAVTRGLVRSRGSASRASR